MRQYRAFRIGQHHFRFRRHALEEAPKARQRAARTDAAHDSINLPLHLPPDLRRRRGLVGQRVGLVAELVDVEGIVQAGGDFVGQILVVFGMALADIRPRDSHIGAQRPQVQDLLARHLVRNHQDQLIALASRDQSQPQPRVARRRLDDRGARLQPPVALRRLDHRQGDAVLDRAAGVLAFQLHEQPARPGVETGYLNHRRIADQAEHPRPGRRRYLSSWHVTNSLRC